VRRIESIVWVGGASELGRLFVLPCADPERDPARIRRLCGRPERPPVVALVRAPAVPSFERALAEAGAAAVLETPAAGAADGLGARLVGVARELHRRPSAPRPLRHAELAPGLVPRPRLRRLPRRHAEAGVDLICGWRAAQKGPKATQNSGPGGTPSISS